MPRKQAIDPILADLIEKFRRAGVPEPVADAQILAAHVAGCSRAEVAAGLVALTEEQSARLQELAFRRAQREPMAYILERVEFYGLEFRVTEATKIPTPSTETLVDAAIRCGGKRILDFGTGCGNIAICVARALPESVVFANDISEAALTIADENARRHQTNVAFGRTARNLDLLLSNPPYVPYREKARLQPEVGFEPANAIFGGEDGLEFVRLLLSLSGRYLRPGGVLMFEFGCGQADAVRSFAGPCEILKDLDGIERVCIIRT